MPKALLIEKFKQVAELLQHLVKCSNSTEMNDIYLGFFKTAFEDYQKEFNEVTAIGQKTMNGLITPTGAGQKQQKLNPQGVYKSRGLSYDFTRFLGCW